MKIGSRTRVADVLSTSQDGAVGRADVLGRSLYYFCNKEFCAKLFGVVLLLLRERRVCE